MLFADVLRYSVLMKAIEIPAQQHNVQNTRFISALWQSKLEALSCAVVVYGEEFSECSILNELNAHVIQGYQGAVQEEMQLGP